MKPVRFHPKAQEFIRSMSVSLKKQIGEALRDVQKGLIPTMPLNKPMPNVGAGVYEFRVKDEVRKVRVFYIVKIKNYILVFHAFEKKTQKTPIHEIELGKKRLREFLND